MNGKRTHPCAPFLRRSVVSAVNRYALPATVLTDRMPGVPIYRDDRETSGTRCVRPGRFRGTRYALRKAPRHTQITRHTMPSNFRRISNKTNDWHPHKVTHYFEVGTADRTVLPVTACRVEINVSDSEQRTDVRSTRHWNEGAATHAHEPQFEKTRRRIVARQCSWLLSAEDGTRSKPSFADTFRMSVVMF
jgi:hypothetical protein